MTNAVKYTDCILILTYKSHYKLSIRVICWRCWTILVTQDLYPVLPLGIAEGTILHTIRYVLKHNIEVLHVFVLGLLYCLKDSWMWSIGNL